VVRQAVTPDLGRIDRTSLGTVDTQDAYRRHLMTSETGIARIFRNGRSQAVRLPLAFRLPGDRARVRRTATGILLEPIAADIEAWFAELDRFADVPFMEDGRRQPPMPPPKDSWD
jgi:antitoxin VapB